MAVVPVAVVEALRRWGRWRVVRGLVEEVGGGEGVWCWEVGGEEVVGEREVSKGVGADS